MTDEERRHAAQAVLEIPFFSHLWDELEHAATNACIFAKMNDDETRRNAAAEVRAIKSVRSRLETIARDGQSSGSRRAPA